MHIVKLMNYTLGQGGVNWLWLGDLILLACEKTNKNTNNH